MDTNKNDDVIRLGDIFRVLWKNIILIAIITVAVFVVGIIYTFGIARPQYSSSSTFLVAVSTPSTGGSDNVNLSDSLRLVTTAAQLVTEDNTLRPVAEDNDLSVTELRDMVSVSYNTDSFLVTVTVECGNSTLSMRLANELVESLIDIANTDGSGVDILFKNTISMTSSATRGVYSSPNRALYLAIFFIGGLVVACIVVYIKEFCSNKFRNRDDIENYLDQKVLGYFIDDKTKDKNLSKDEREARQVELVEPGIRAYEPYNKLFTNIRYSNVDNPYRVIMITSSQEKELKSTTIGNFACCMAYNKLNVVLIDMDMRKPVQHKLFKVSKDKGISEYVGGTCSEGEIIKHTKYGVDVITTGKKVINPVVIIESAAFKQLIADLAAKYDYVLIDTPPALACSDAAAISKLCDGVIFNVSMRDVKKKKAAIAVQSLKDVNANIIGVNVTKAVADKHDDSYYYYSDKYYSNAQVQPEKSAPTASATGTKSQTNNSSNTKKSK